jgi:hypothetical protein
MFRSLIHPVQQVFEVVEPALPKACHLVCPFDQRSEGTELRTVMGLATVVAVAHQASLLEDGQMLRHAWLGNSGTSRQDCDSLITLAAQPLENGAPRWVGKRLKKHVPIWGGNIWHRNP